MATRSVRAMIGGMSQVAVELMMRLLGKPKRYSVPSYTNMPAITSALFIVFIPQFRRMQRLTKGVANGPLNQVCYRIKDLTSNCCIRANFSNCYFIELDRPKPPKRGCRHPKYSGQPSLQRESLCFLNPTRGQIPQVQGLTLALCHNL